MTFAAIGRPAVVQEYLEQFAVSAQADELIVAFQSTSAQARLRSAELLAGANSGTLQSV